MNIPRKVFEKENHSEVSNSRELSRIDKLKSHVGTNSFNYALGSFVHLIDLACQHYAW
jgi:hypothetical protein